MIKLMWYDFSVLLFIPTFLLVFDLTIVLIVKALGCEAYWGTIFDELLMSARFRFLYLLIGFVGLGLLGYLAFDTYPYINFGHVLLITTGDMVFFFLAYKTYPA
jgi:hypothetical protein